MLRLADSHRPFRPGSSALRTGFLVSGGAATAVVALAVVRQDNDSGLRQSLEEQAALNRTLSDLQDAESNQRGFLLTGETGFFRLYEGAVERVGRDVAALEGMSAEDDRKRASILRLKSLAEARIAELAATLDAAKAGDRTAALTGLRPREDGTRMVETARSYIAEIVAMEASEIERRRRRARIAGGATVLATAGLFALMTVLSLAALREARRREVLARYLPREVAALLADGATSLREGDQRDAAVAFVDMRGSTALAERLTPRAFMAVLSEYRGRVSEAARLASGMVDKFVGDGALVVFGLTGRTEHAAADALRFADLLLAPPADAPPGDASDPIRIGIGVHHGPLFCGVLGDMERQEFTVLGDTVNVAARLQDQSKVLGTPLVVSGSVLAAAGADAADWHRVGPLTLPGRREPVEVYARPASDTGSSAPAPRPRAAV